MGTLRSKPKLDKICIVNTDENTNSLYDAIIRNDLTQCTRVIEEGLDLNEELKFSYGNADGKRTFCRYIRTFGLHLACIHRRQGIVKVLLEHGANPALQDYMERQPVSLVLLYWPRIHCLEVSGLNKREIEYQIYLTAQHKKSEGCLVSLLRHGVNPDDVCNRQDKRSPLHLCAKYNLIHAIPILVNRGANLNIRDVNGITPLILATKLGNLASVQVLLKSGADANARDDKDCTALHYASAADTSSSTTLLAWLVTYGAYINICDRNGDTPLHLAASAGRENCIDFLLNKMADPDVRNVLGQTPLFALLNRACPKACTYAFRRLILESRQPSIIDSGKSLPAHCHSEACQFPLDHLVEMSCNPSTLEWQARHTIRRSLGTQRLNITNVLSLPLPSFLRNCIILNSDVLR